MKDFRTIQQELAQPFAPEDLEWRISVTTQDKTKGMAVPYVTSRAIQDRLDGVLGSENWRNEYQPWHSGGKKGAQICGISLYLEERSEWVTKWDGAEDTDIESVKGGLSDSMKRAAVQWGVGRVLYKIPPIWVAVEPRGRGCVIKDSERGKLDRAYTDALRRLGLTPARPGGLQSEFPTRGNPNDEQETAPANREQNAGTRSPVIPGQGAAERPRQTSGGSEYVVLDAKVQNGMKGPTTSLTLQRIADRKNCRVFFNGTDQRLTPGVELTGVRMKLKKQDNVEFLVLERFEIMTRYRNAA